MRDGQLASRSVDGTTPRGVGQFRVPYNSTAIHAYLRTCSRLGLNVAVERGREVSRFLREMSCIVHCVLVFCAAAPFFDSYNMVAKQLQPCTGMLLTIIQLLTQGPWD